MLPVENCGINTFGENWSGASRLRPLASFCLSYPVFIGTLVQLAPRSSQALALFA